MAVATEDKGNVQLECANAVNLYIIHVFMICWKDWKHWNGSVLFDILKRYLLVFFHVSINRFQRESKTQNKADATIPKMMNKGRWLLFMNLVFLCISSTRSASTLLCQLCVVCWRSLLTQTLTARAKLFRTWIFHDQTALWGGPRMPLIVY